MKGKKKRIIAITLAGVLVVGLVAGLLLRGSGGAVRVFAVNEIAESEFWGDYAETEGYVETRNIQSVYLSDTQLVKEVFVSQGQTVKKGDPICSYDTTLSDLELERARLSVEKKKQALEAARRELAQINSYVPYTGTVAPEPEPEPLEPRELPMLLKGEGTEDSPYVYLWNDECWYTDRFVNSLVAQLPIPAEEAEPQYVYVVFENREYDNENGELLSRWGMKLCRMENGEKGFALYEPAPETDGLRPEPAPGWDGPQYTAAEIARMRQEKLKEIADTELEAKVLAVKYEKLKLELDNGVVTAEVDGVVKTVSEPISGADEPFIVVSGGGGYYIQGAVGEFALDTLQIGQTVKVTSWMNGILEQEGQVVEISQIPAGNDKYGWTGGNPNITYYPFTVFVDEDASLRAGEYVSIQYSAAEAETGIYLESPFVWNEGAKSYVYVADENGKLRKREIRVGKVLWGSLVQVLDGVTMDDYVAFPYGKNIKDGAKTVPSDMQALYDGLY